MRNSQIAKPRLTKVTKGQSSLP
ncbi:hypothetical protein CO2235_180024 [Cupriavidus oxalaticus]|uniref:Uncharacterized protein n=1 Tax=Cupriavidus oxalaticus TaxID=96344 RepID=A0A375G512_9BURK|nr:hypothetical protein CO2235_180024 [Cupriavidus oxalaticus]